MNNTLQAQAQKLFFQSDLSKTEISEILGIPRRTLHYWIREKNWDRIKRSAAQMPSLLAENIYHIIARFTQQLLGEDRINRPITHKEADTLHKLTLTVGKLKTRNTLNESMEMFGMFMESVNSKSPEMAQQLVPFVDDYIAGRAATNIQQFRPDNMNDLGLIPKQEANLTEEQLDMQDIMAWTEEGEISPAEVTTKEEPAPTQPVANDASTAVRHEYDIDIPEELTRSEVPLGNDFSRTSYEDLIEMDRRIRLGYQQYAELFPDDEDAKAVLALLDAHLPNAKAAA